MGRAQARPSSSEVLPPEPEAGVCPGLLVQLRLLGAAHGAGHTWSVMPGRGHACSASEGPAAPLPGLLPDLFLCDRLFSDSGQVQTERRRSLDPDLPQALRRKMLP